MNLLERISTMGHGAVAPLIGFPGAVLTNTSLRQNVSDAETHIASIRAVHRRWAPDIVFPMMDLAVEAHALGLPVRFPENESPTVERHPVQSADDLQPLRERDILSDARLQSFLQAVEAISALPETLHGAYVIGPFTLSGLLAGASQVALATIRAPGFVHALLEFSIDVIISYARACVDSGAELIAFLEPTAALLSPKAFAEFSGRYVTILREALPTFTVLHVCGNTTRLLSAMCETKVDGLSLDAAVDFAAAAQTVPGDVVLIGNIDPVGVMGAANPDVISHAVRELREKMHGHENFVLSTGCDLPMDTPLDNIDAFMEVGRQLTSRA